jgi:Carboxypeptidase regulatory-like domain/TonB dependent receptor-like, beta-barrel
MTMRPFLCAFTTIFCLTASALAQVDTGTITGTITDPSGAVLAGASVILTHEESKTSRTVLTNDVGYYAAPNLHVGSYSIRAELSGFKTQEQRGIVLRLQERLRVDFRLQIGELAEVVSVTGTPPILETETSNLGQVVEQRTVENLPLNGRNFVQLALLSAGVTPSHRTVQRDTFVSNGMRPIQNSYIVDGMENKTHVTGFDNSSAQAHRPSIDAIQEFKVQTSTFSAEYGQGAGAVLTATIKSGSNSFHGSAFEFHRNAVLDATPFFQPPDTDKPQFIENQFGATLGGPIRKNSAFFFFSYEGTRIVSGAPRIGTVPTADMREGRFGTRQIYDPATVRPNPSGTGFIRDLFPNNSIPAARWDPVAVKVLQLAPLPNLPGAVNNHFYNPRQTVIEDSVDARVDVRLGANDSLFGRFSLSNGENLLPPTLPAPANDPSTAYPSGRSFVMAYTRTFSSKVVNETRWGFNRSLLVQDIETPRLFEEFGINEPAKDPAVKGLPEFAISGLSTLGTAAPNAGLPLQVTGSGNLPIKKAGMGTTLSDVVSILHGNHSLKLGAEVWWNQLNANVTLTARPNFNFNGVYTQNPQSRTGNGHAFADFLLGLANNATTSTRGVSGLRNRNYLFFVQDDWKLTRRFTLNLGLRYELVTPYYEVNDRQSQILFDNAGVRLVTAGSGGDSLFDRAFVRLDRNNFAPRLGFAYQAREKTVVRAGFGVFYGRDEDIGVSRRLVSNPPWFVRTTFPSDQINPNIKLSTGIPDGTLDPSSVRNPEVNHYPEESPLPYVLQWSLNIQQELPHDFLFHVGYTGSVSQKLYLPVNINRPLPGPGAVDLRRPYQGFSNIFVYGPSVRGNYHALFVRAERRFSAGYSLLTSYTLGHSIDSGKFQNEGGADVQNYLDRNAERASSNNDMRHRLVASFIYESPFGRGKRWAQSGPAAALLGDWRWTGIGSLNSGLPFSVTMQTDTSNSLAPLRPNRVGDGNLSRSQQTLERYFDLDAFVAPAPFTFGNAGRNILRGPGAVNFDFGVHRDFRITEGVSFQFRAELFNAFNTPQFNDPASVLGNPQAGVIGSPTRGTERQIQFGARLAF